MTQGSSTLESDFARQALGVAFKVRAAYAACGYRVTGGHALFVHFGSPNAVSLTVRWGRGRGSSEHILTVRPSWAIDVGWTGDLAGDRGAAVVAGLLTLDLASMPVEDPKRWKGSRGRIFQAAWVRQGLATSLSVRRGYLVAVGDGAEQRWHHADTERAARLALSSVAWRLMTVAGRYLARVGTANGERVHLAQVEHRNRPFGSEEASWLTTLCGYHSDSSYEGSADQVDCPRCLREEKKLGLPRRTP